MCAFCFYACILAFWILMFNFHICWIINNSISKMYFDSLRDYWLFWTDEPFPPSQPKCIEQDRDHITIAWEPPENDGGNPVQGYIVERKEPKSNRWTPINRGLVPVRHRPMIRIPNPWLCNCMYVFVPLEISINLLFFLGVWVWGWEGYRREGIWIQNPGSQWGWKLWTQCSV